VPRDLRLWEFFRLPLRAIDKALPGCDPAHSTAKVSAWFDDPNLVAYGGLAPVVRLAERCGLAEQLIRLPKSVNGTGAFAAAKLMTLTPG
jgi:hypothetical protein